MAYNIYQSKYPADQEPPDPNKKTLVILGMYALELSWRQYH